MRSGCDSSPARSRKFGSAPVASPLSPTGQSPQSFVLLGERDMRQSSSHDERPDLAHVITTCAPGSDPPKAETLEDSIYGVQSLQGTLHEAFPHPTSPERPAAAADAPLAGRTSYAGAHGSIRGGKIGRPVHPKIAAAARRIMSSDHSRTSSISSSTSPHRGPVQSTSATPHNLSSASLHLSPRRGSAMSGTPRSSSVRSLGLSDEEGSLFDDCASQVIHSSSEDEDLVEGPGPGESGHAHAGPQPTTSTLPQLVMPSLSMPKRRPFTERGRNMGRLKVLVVGSSGVGKTSLIRNILQSCEDVVHVDFGGANWQSKIGSLHTKDITEINASTRAYPPWWSDIDERRDSKRKQAMGGTILDRNICFVDTPGWNNSGTQGEENLQVVTDDVVAYIEDSLRQNASMSQLGDSDILRSLSGGGGFQVDLILYVFPPGCGQITTTEMNVLRHLSALTNMIPIIGKADSCPEKHIKDSRATLGVMLESAGITPFALRGRVAEDPFLRGDVSDHVYAVSSATGDDDSVMDASLLMSSDYLQPLLPSDLSELGRRLFEPDNIQHLRHCAVKKFLSWRKGHLGTSIQSQKQELEALYLRRPVTAGSLQASIASSVSGVLVPYSSSDLHRSRHTSDLACDGWDFADMTGSRAQMSIADWAQDLQRALDTERLPLFRDDDPGQVVLHKAQPSSGHDNQRDRRATAKGKRGKPVVDSTSKRGYRTSLACIQDPMGILALGDALGRQGRLVLRVLGACGVFATAAVWFARNWTTVTEVLGLRPETQIPAGYAFMGDKDDWREVFWSGRW